MHGTRKLILAFPRPPLGAEEELGLYMPVPVPLTRLPACTAKGKSPKLDSGTELINVCL